MRTMRKDFGKGSVYNNVTLSIDSSYWGLCFNIGMYNPRHRKPSYELTINILLFHFSIILTPSKWFNNG